MFVTDATSLHIIMNCTGSRLLPDYPRASDGDTTLREEGNAAHWLAQQAFEGKVNITEYIETFKAPNGVLVTPQMFEHVREYLAELCPGVMEIETSHGNGIYQVNGRADHIGYDRVTDTLYVDDFKYGYSIVEPTNNWTLVSHAVGWVIKNAHYPANISFRIHQPRPYHPLGHMREWRITGHYLGALLEIIVKKLSNLDDMLNTGPYCNKCSKLGNCPAARNANMNAIDNTQEAFTDTMSDEVLADELRLVEYSANLIKHRLDALKDMALDRVKHGKAVPGFGLERTYSNTTWLKHVTPEMVTAMTGKKLTVEKLCTPSEAKARGVPEMILKVLTARIETGVKLVSFDPNAKAAKLFNQGEK